MTENDRLERLENLMIDDLEQRKLERKRDSNAGKLAYFIVLAPIAVVVIFVIYVLSILM